MKRYLLLVCGIAMLVLTYIGILLPGVPAIPFFLIALFCFAAFSANSSEKIRRLPLLGPLMRGIERAQEKTWFVWLVASQLVVSAVVAERLLSHSVQFSILWYAATAVIVFAFVLLLRKMK